MAITQNTIHSIQIKVGLAFKFLIFDFWIFGISLINDSFRSIV